MHAGPTGSVKNQDMDATTPPPLACKSTERDGFDSGHPNFQGRFGGTLPSRVDGNVIAAGAWGYWAAYETDRAYGGNHDFTAWLGGVNRTVPLFGPVSLRGDAQIDSALGDVRGSIGQTLNTDPTSAAFGHEIDAIGGWVELVLQATDCFTVTLGGTIDNADSEDLAQGYRDLNWTLYLATKYDIGSGWKAGLDVIYWETQWVDLHLGNAVRMDLYTQLDF